MSKEVTADQHAKFLAGYQAGKSLTQKTNPQHVPPMTYWESDRGQVLALVTHDPKLGDRFFICPQFDNKTADPTKDTPGDAAMKVAVAAVSCCGGASGHKRWLVSTEKKKYWRQVWCLAFHSFVSCGMSLDEAGRLSTERADLALKQLRKNGGAPR